ncbi:MAG: hypothetical protein AAB401_04570 [Acidobacteriota bacterium]
MVKAQPTSAMKAFPNSPNGSWGIVKAQPDPVVRLDLNNPPTPVGGIRSEGSAAFRSGFNNPPTPVGGIREVIFFRVLSLAALIASTSTAAFAQCAMCKANIAGAENSADVSSAVNSGVLVLLIPTLAIIGGVIRLVFKYRN